jgi:D-sedoheptulose 7-phosphate isomerase
MEKRIQQILQESIEVKQALLTNDQLLKAIKHTVEVMVHTFQEGGKVLFCGNGGSAADAQHIAAELSGRFYQDRDPLFAEALHVNTSYLTAVANDYGYDAVFARLVKAMGRPGDILVGLSTSGNSKNVLQALKEARSLGMTTVGMTGAEGGAMREASDILLNVPSQVTPRIQEAHITLGHILCELVEATLFS